MCFKLFCNTCFDQTRIPLHYECGTYRVYREIDLPIDRRLQELPATIKDAPDLGSGARTTRCRTGEAGIKIIYPRV
ncbi:MAG: hypothetical protein D5R96_07870 [Methanocalculus sp. MSAO_Arc2]|nr:MAG: hypothetical protein D5R96_07870 [Methanocalculus sp. MSAO_Arc2]